MLAAPTVADARLVAEAIGVEPHVEEVLLFGSVARGEANAGSDIDLMVIVHDHTPEAATVTADAHGRAAVRSGWPCDILFEQRSRWQHLIRNVVSSSEAAIAAHALTLFKNAARLTDASSDARILQGVERDDIEVAADHLDSAAVGLSGVRRILHDVGGDERTAHNIASDLNSADYVLSARRDRYRELLAAAHFAIELAAKSVRASHGADVPHTHDLDALVAGIPDASARDAISGAMASLPRDAQGKTRSWRTAPYRRDKPEWVAETTAANAAVHVHAAISAVTSASAILQDRAGDKTGRDSLIEAVAKAANQTDALAELNITADSITTGDGLRPVEQPEPPAAPAKSRGFLRRLFTGRPKNASSPNQSPQNAKTGTAGQQHTLLEPASPSSAKCDATTAEGTQCQHPRPAPGGSCAAGHKRA